MRSMPPTLRLLLLSVLSVTVSTQPVFLLGATFFQIGPELHLGTIGLGGLTAAFFLTASAASAPLGRWVQRVGWRRAIRLNMTVSGTLLVAIGLLTHSAWTMALFLVASAVMYGATNPAANRALADHTDPAWQATIFGAKHAGIPASTLLAGLAVPAIVVHFGWRWAYALGAFLAVAVAMLIPDRGFEEEPPRPDPADRPAPTPMNGRQLVALAFGSSFGTWAAMALGTYLVSGALAVGFSESAAGTLQFVGSLCSIGARIALGAVTDRRRGRGFTAIATVTAVGAVFFWSMAGRSGATFAVLVLIAFMTGWGWPGLMTFTVVSANRSQAAASSAITQAGVFVGAGLGPLLLAAVIERWSFAGAWRTAALGLVMAATLVFAVGRMVARSTASRA